MLAALWQAFAPAGTARARQDAGWADTHTRLATPRRHPAKECSSGQGDDAVHAGIWGPALDAQGLE